MISGSLFTFHKMPLRTYLAAVLIFCNEVKGKSAPALSRDLDVQYRRAFVQAHKLRKVMSGEVRGHQLGGLAPMQACSERPGKLLVSECAGPNRATTTLAKIAGRI